MKVALIQLDTVWESKGPNLAKAEALAERASGEGCDIVVLPEMFSTGFSMNLAATAEEGYGETAAALSSIAKKNAIHLIAGFPIKSPAEDKGRNMAFVYNREGRLNAAYSKIHPFSYAGEDRYFIAGTDTVVFEIEGMPASVFICYDLRFPELFRSVSRAVKAVFVLANWSAERKEHWETLLRARAIENQCFVIGVNRTGTDGNGISYPGASAIYGPSGNVVCSGNDTDEFIVGEFDPREADEVRSRYPFLRDMRDP